MGYAVLGYRRRYTAGILRRCMNTKPTIDIKDIQRGLKLPPNEQRIYYGKYLHQLKAKETANIPHNQMVSIVNQLMVKFYRLGMYQSARDAFATLSYPSLQSYLIVAPCMVHILSFEEMVSFADDCMRRTRSVHLDLAIDRKSVV